MASTLVIFFNTKINRHRVTGTYINVNKKLSAVTCLSEENSGGRSVNTLFFKSTVFRDVIFPIIGGTFRKSLLQILRDFGFPLVAFSKILSAILYPCQQCSRAHKLSFGGRPQALENFLLQAF